MLSQIPYTNSNDELQGWVADNYDPDIFFIDDVNPVLMPFRRLRGNNSRA